MPKGFYTKDGKVRPIEGKSGKKGPAAVAATGLALALASTGGGGAAVSSVGGAADSAASKLIQTRTTSAKQVARTGQRSKVWRRMRLRVSRNTLRRDLHCLVHSFGEVQRYLARTPCRSLQRMVIPVADAEGNSFLISVAWVRMSSTSSARGLQQLDDIQGTGDISPLAGPILEAGGVQFTGAHYDSRISRTLFVRAEAAPVSGTPQPALLDGAAELASLFPPP